MKFRFIITLIIMAVAIAPLDAQSSKSVKREQQRNRRQMEQAKRNVQMNAAAVERNLQSLQLLDGEIEDINRDIRRLRHTSDSLYRLIRPLNDSIKTLNKTLDGMCDKYRMALRKSQTNGNNLNDITFVFKAESFKQALERYRTLRQFSRWRARKAAEIVDTRKDLAARQERLDSLRHLNSAALNKVRRQYNEVNKKKVETDRLVKSLRTQTRQLEKVVKKHQEEERRLEARLEKALAEELRQQQERERKEREAEQKRREEAKRQATSASKDTPGKGADSGRKEGSSQQSKSPSVEKTVPAATKSAPVYSAEEYARLTGNFESNKGKLPFPIKGSYAVVKKFGRQKHPRLPKVETNNPGIDISTAAGAKVYAVFSGEVSQIFKLSGYHNVIVLRHGDYVTVYAGIISLDVKKGDKVSAGQPLGNLYEDKADNGRSILHFELRKEKEKKDPELWLKL